MRSRIRTWWLAGALLLGAALLGAPGCATISQASRGGTGADQDKGPAAYGGVRTIANACADISRGVDWGVLPVILMTLDAPFSFALDTVLLPFTVINELARGGIEVPSFLDMWTDRVGGWTED